MFKELFFSLIVLVVAFAAPAKEDRNWRVVGGSDAAVDEAPYQVSVRIRDIHVCGGSILTSQTVLTAAQCVYGIFPGAISVVTGSIYLNTGGTTYLSNKYAWHGLYNEVTFVNDIAIVYTIAEMSFSSSVAPVSLSIETIGAGVSVKLTGWGTTSDPGSVPNTLQKITLTTISDADCNATLSSLNPTYNTQICTLTKAGEGACHGDSGGPLVSEGGQVGIVSWGSPCATGLPDVFTRISRYISWINSRGINI